MFKAVIFDLFSTLVEDHAVASYAPMAARLGIPEDTFLQYWLPHYGARSVGDHTYEDSLRRVCRDVGLRVSPEVIREVASIRTENLRQGLKSVRPQALSTLQALADSGHHLGLLSNAAIELLDEWPHSELAGYFDAVVFSSEVRMMKPNPRVFHLVCEQLLVKVDQCLYVGDGGDDELAAAASLGMTTVQVLTTRPRLADAAYAIDSLDEVLTILRDTT